MSTSHSQCPCPLLPLALRCAAPPKQRTILTMAPAAARTLLALILTFSASSPGLTGKIPPHVTRGLNRCVRCSDGLSLTVVMRVLLTISLLQTPAQLLHWKAFCNRFLIKYCVMRGSHRVFLSFQQVYCSAYVSVFVCLFSRITHVVLIGVDNLE